MSTLLDAVAGGPGGEASDSSPGRSRRRDAGDRAERRRGLLFVAPWLIGLAAFYLIPIVASLAMSFTDSLPIRRWPTRSW
jgi:hypothetical protein